MKNEDRHIALIVSKGGLDEVYPAFILANAARASGFEASIFFTFYGLNAITEKKVDHLHVNLAGNASNPIPTVLAGLPGMETVAAKAMTKLMADLDVPGPREMVSILSDSGCHLYAC